MAKAKLEIRIWTDEGRDLPDDLSEALESHAEHVAGMLAQGYVAGEIVDESFRGWWDVTKDGGEG